MEPHENRGIAGRRHRSGNRHRNGEGAEGAGTQAGVRRGAGGRRRLRRSGRASAGGDADLAKAADAILFGAVGGPKYDTLPRPKRPEQALLGLRKELNLFANLRPAVVYPELASASTIKPEVVAGLDILILRELTGDIYFGQPRGMRTNAAGEREGFDTMLYSESEVRRIAHGGFKAAMKRSSKLCSVDKANVLETSQL